MEQAEKNTILIVDDNRINLMVLVNILQPDYTLFTARDGARPTTSANPSAL